MKRCTIWKCKTKHKRKKNCKISYGHSKCQVRYYKLC